MGNNIEIKKRIQAKEEGVTLTNDLSSLNFVGSGVTASTVGDDVTVTVPGSIGSTTYYLNQTVTQAPYKEFSSVPTSAAEQDIPTVVGIGATELLGAYQTPSGYPNTTNIPAGLWQFFVHLYSGVATDDWDVYIEVYKRDLSAVETLIFTTDIEVVTNMPTSTTMYLLDGVFPTTSLLTTDRLVIKVYATNTGSGSQTIHFITEGSAHYSVGTTTLNQIVGAGSVTSVTGTAPIVSSGGTTPAISISQASGSTDGYLSSTNWNTFNSKESALTFSSPLSRAVNTISIPLATSLVNGYLSSTDWSTFNGKQDAITLTTTGTSGAATLIGSTLNIPQYAGGLVYFTEAQSTSAPNATINVDSLTAVASTVNADIALVPKGNGAFLLDIPDSSITGGNKRGTNAIDLQISRTASTQVASGNYSVAIGYSNTASNTSATAIGQLNIASAIGSTALGYSNTSSGSYSTTSGFTNTASGNYSFAVGYNSLASNLYAIALGQSCTASNQSATAIGLRCKATGESSLCIGGYFYSDSTASGQNSLVVGYGTASSNFSTAIGSSNTSSGAYGTAIGYGANTFSLAGRISMSGNVFTSIGDAQKSIVRMGRRTTDNTITTLTTDNSASITIGTQLTLQNQQLIRYKGSITGKQSGSINVAVWDIDGVIVRGANAGTTTLTISNINLITNAPGWSTPTISADTTNGTLKIDVQGLAGTNIQWLAILDTIENLYL